MESTISDVLKDFLAETEQLVEHVDELPAETVSELYSLLRTASAAAADRIGEIDPELRRILCERLDVVMEQFIDAAPVRYPAGVNIFTPAVHAYRRWRNEELMKDKCLAGYMLAGEMNAHAKMMFGTSTGSYPYTEILPGLELLCTDVPAGTPAVYYEHLQKNYQKMDVLILHGMYGETIPYLDAYRVLRPEGKVFCALDMNSYWMSRIPWDAPEVVKFASQCDAIATSCRQLRDALNANPKVPFVCRWLSNGFYNPTGETISVDAGLKRNVVLTVGRIGTAEKNNAELLLGFARAAKYMPGWRLRLVGPVEDGFQPFIKQFFSSYPHLKSRVTFTGPIIDKTALYREYAQAKIFALTSPSEGGTPNVYSEALVHGCMFVTSNIDAADDVTDYGRLGEKYPLGDLDALARALSKVASQTNLSSMQKHIEQAQGYARQHYDWYRNAKKIACMLYANDTEEGAGSPS